MNRLGKFMAVCLLLFGTSVLQAQDLVLLHTNDMHSQVEPDPATGKMGFQAIADYVRTVRSQHENVLLLDAGDFNQGTPYFNLYGGEVEIAIMNRIGYDVVALGNHEFDNGVAKLAKRLRKADFEVVCANYEFSKSPLRRTVKPYAIVEVGEYKIGIIGALADLTTLTGEANRKGIRYLADVPTIIDGYAELLKKEEKCDLVIALSHLGFDNYGMSDIILAENSKYIDLIVGGHSHTFLPEPYKVRNLEGKVVPIVQTGAKTRYIGRFDIYF